MVWIQSDRKLGRDSLWDGKKELEIVRDCACVCVGERESRWFSCSRYAESLHRLESILSFLSHQTGLIKKSIPCLWPSNVDTWPLVLSVISSYDPVDKSLTLWEWVSVFARVLGASVEQPKRRSRGAARDETILPSVRETQLVITQDLPWLMKPLDKIFWRFVCIA